MNTQQFKQGDKVRVVDAEKLLEILKETGSRYLPEEGMVEIVKWMAGHQGTVEDCYPKMISVRLSQADGRCFRTYELPTSAVTLLPESVPTASFYCEHNFMGECEAQCERCMESVPTAETGLTLEEQGEQDYLNERATSKYGLSGFESGRLYELNRKEAVFSFPTPKTEGGEEKQLPTDSDRAILTNLEGDLIKMIADSGNERLMNKWLEFQDQRLKMNSSVVETIARAIESAPNASIRPTDTDIYERVSALYAHIEDSKKRGDLTHAAITGAHYYQNHFVLADSAPSVSKVSNDKLRSLLNGPALEEALRHVFNCKTEDNYPLAKAIVQLTIKSAFLPSKIEVSNVKEVVKSTEFDKVLEESLTCPKFHHPLWKKSVRDFLISALSPKGEPVTREGIEALGWKWKFDYGTPGQHSVYEIGNNELDFGPENITEAFKHGETIGIFKIETLEALRTLMIQVGITNKKD